MAHRRQYDVVISSGTSLSNAADILNRRLVGIEMPAAWTAASISFQVDTVPTGAFGLLHDDAGNHMEILAQAGDRITLSIDNQDLLRHWRYIKVESTAVGIPTTPVNQAADRTVRLIIVDV